MNFLRQSTAVDVLIGPFVDSTDGYSAETALSPSVSLSKNGQALAAKNDATTPTHDANGYYNCELDATDTNTVGTLVLIVPGSATSLPVRHEFQVVEEATYDMLYASGATPLADINAECDTAISDASLATSAALATVDSNVDAILVDTGTTLDSKLDDIMGATFSTATDSLEAIRNRGDSAWTGSAITSDSGTAQAGAASSITLQAGASGTDDTYNGQVIYISSGTGAGQSRAIGDYNGTTKVATVITDWATAPDNTSVYEIYPDEITEITPAPTADAVADAVWDEPTAGHTTAGSFGEQCKNDIDAILVDTGSTLDSAIATIDANVDAILVDTAEIGAAGAGLTAIPWNAAWDAEVQSECTDALNAYDPPTNAELNALIGTPAGADLATDIATIDANVDAVLVDTGTTLDAAIGVVDANVDAIRVVTDQFNFTVAGEVDANVESINATTVIGVGTTANKWRA